MTQVAAERGGTEHLGMWGIPSFYPTPDSLIYAMLEKITITPNDHILEPSAGKGNIARILDAHYPENRLTLVERDPLLRAVLIADGYRVSGVRDFFNWSLPVDVILMNPPFSANYQDADHIRHAWAVLKRGGRLAAICHWYTAGRQWENPIYKPAVFQRWLKSQGLQVEQNPLNAFNVGEHQTVVPTALLWGTKA